MSEYSSIKEFLEGRDEQNGILLSGADRILKRVLSVDSSAYAPGALDEGTKELLGLTASLVLRCDDCIAWHVHRCIKTGVSREQFTEALGIGAVVGGTITIPHIRRAMALWGSEHLEDNGEN